MQPAKGLDPLVLWAHRVCGPDTARVYETQAIARKASDFGADFSRLKTSKECSAWNTAVRLRTGDVASARHRDRRRRPDAVGWIGNAGYPRAWCPRRSGECRPDYRGMRRKIWWRHEFIRRRAEGRHGLLCRGDSGGAELHLPIRVASVLQRRESFAVPDADVPAAVLVRQGGDA